MNSVSGRRVGWRDKTALSMRGRAARTRAPGEAADAEVGADIVLVHGVLWKRRIGRGAACTVSNCGKARSG